MTTSGSAASALTKAPKRLTVSQPSTNAKTGSTNPQGIARIASGLVSLASTKIVIWTSAAIAAKTPYTAPLRRYGRRFSNVNSNECAASSASWAAPAAVDTAAGDASGWAAAAASSAGPG